MNKIIITKILKKYENIMIIPYQYYEIDEVVLVYLLGEMIYDPDTNKALEKLEIFFGIYKIIYKNDSIMVLYKEKE